MHRNPISLIMMFLALSVAAAACVASSPPDGGGGSGGSGSTGEVRQEDAGWTFTGPACYFNDDCDWGSPDGGTCGDAGTCVPHPPGWCLLTSLCPLPPDTSCASAWCNPYLEQCVFNDAPKGSGCWVGPDAGKHECDGHGACVPAETLEPGDAGAD